MDFEQSGHGQILCVEEVKTKTQVAIVKTYYDQEFHIKLSCDKSTIDSDGVDTVIIHAKVYNYLNEPQDSWVGDITFELNGEEIIIPAENGEATIEFNTEVKGNYTIKTKITNFRNGELEVIAI